METPSGLDALNRRFSLPGLAQILPGHGGFPIVRITLPLAHADISLYGAQVLRWRPAGQQEVLFLSDHSRWQTGQAIRGGIPVCFPWFREQADNPAAPKHGFVRTRQWHLNSLHADPDGAVTLVCVTSSDDATRALWPHDFLLALRIHVAGALTLELSVTNRGPAPFRFEEALHTYFRVGDVRQARVRGLDAVHYLDNTAANILKTQDGPLTFSAPTDNAFIHTGSSVDILDPVLHRRLRTQKLHSATTIVWNPWQTGAAAMADLGDNEWQRILCVEAGNILTAAVSLDPGQQHTLRATLSVLPE